MTSSPVYDLPFPARLNPRAGLLEEHMRRRGLASKARFDQLVARMYPTAPWPLLGSIGQIIVWLFLYDDRLDPGGTPSAHDEFVRSTEQALTEAGPGGSADPVVRCLASWRAEVESTVPAAWWQNCVADLVEVVRSIAREHRAQDFPSLDAYRSARLHTSGWTLLTDLAELADDAVLPQSMRHLPMVRQLRVTAGDVACAVNDLLSLGKEIKAGECHNQVLIVRREEECTLQEAIERTENWAAGRLRDYLNLRGALVSDSHVRQRALVDRYATGMENLMRGSLDWSIGTSRYLQPELEQTR
ncbi:hypothetical protein ACIBUY_39615 [Streptomyces sp. NPDC050085]|uniref:terpene synthase family protein n=1 Tax=Streptomyces sp. NPDC050085 TaxID=3365600 RepID=UPI00379FFC2A